MEGKKKSYRGRVRRLFSGGLLNWIYISLSNSFFLLMLNMISNFFEKKNKVLTCWNPDACFNWCNLQPAENVFLQKTSDCEASCENTQKALSGCIFFLIFIFPLFY